MAVGDVEQGNRRERADERRSLALRHVPHGVLHAIWRREIEQRWAASHARRDGVDGEEVG